MKLDFELHWLAVEMLEQFLQQKLPPIVRIERPLIGGDFRDSHGDKAYGHAQVARYGEYWVPDSPVLADEISWSVTQQGEFVPVPLFAYRTQHAARASIFATGVELGMRAMLDLSAHCKKPPQAVTLVMGPEVHSIETENGSVYRAYLGVAFRV